MKLEIKVYSARCDECEDGQINYYTALRDTEGAYYYCENCDAEYIGKQMYSLPNSKLIKTVNVDIEEE